MISMDEEPRTELPPDAKKALFSHLIQRHPRLTVKILLGFNPDGLDRLTIALGKGSEYDYRLLEDPEFREAEIRRYMREIKATNATSM
jgi:hypothetical protein